MTSKPPHPASPLARLAAEPQRFDFDAAVRLLNYAAGTTRPEAVARFRTEASLAYPGADVLSVRMGTPPTVVTSVMGLVGATGVLPRSFTERVTVARREKSPSVHDFVDMLSDRLVAHFAAAGARYRPARAAEAAQLDSSEDRIAQVLLALTGYGSADLAGRLACGTEPLLYYSGFFAARPRAADRIAALASDWLGSCVQVQEFVGTWLPVPQDQQTRLPEGSLGGQFCCLGNPPANAADAALPDPAVEPGFQGEAAIGVRSWDVQGRIVLRIGPLDGAAFASLLPGRARLGRFVALVRAFLGFETGFAVNLAVAASDIPPLQLGDEARLGWNTWLPGEFLAPAADPLFDADIVEAETASRCAA